MFPPSLTLAISHLKACFCVHRINDGVEIEFGFDRLIGCDGAHSIVRQAYLKTPLFNYNQTYIDHGYMELRIPSENPNKVLRSELNSYTYHRIITRILRYVILLYFNL